MAFAADPPPLQVSSVDLCAVKRNAASALQAQQGVVACRMDRLFAGLILLQWLGMVIVTGVHRDKWPAEIGMGGGAVMAVSAVVLALTRAGRPATRHALGVIQVVLSASLGRLLGGNWDWPLPVFGTLALLALYRDWHVLVSASAAALFTPLLRVSPGDDAWGWIEQTGGVTAEGALLLFCCRQSLRELSWLAERQFLLQAAESVIGEVYAKARASETGLQTAQQRLAEFHRESEDRSQSRAEELAQANDALQRNNSVLRAQQEATVDGILVVNEYRDVSSYNQRFCEVWQVPDGLMTANEDWTLLQHILSCAKHPERFQALMTRCYENLEEHAQDELELIDGRILERYTRPIFSETDQYFGRVWYFRDITDRKRAEAQILGLNRQLSLVNEAIIQAYDATIEGWSRALDLRDKETEGHCQRVTDLTMRLAVAMGLCGEDLIQIRRGALLHDIGKMGIPDHILLKPGPLTEDEWQIMRRHPQYAYEMLRPISFLRAALDIPWCHHEKWDGTGYPRGLAGEAIPLSARLFSLVDVWDALRSDRPYRKAWSEDRVREHLCSCAGTHFDPTLVPLFLSVVSSCDRFSAGELSPAGDFFSAPDMPLELPWAA